MSTLYISGTYSIYYPSDMLYDIVTITIILHCSFFTKFKNKKEDKRTKI